MPTTDPVVAEAVAQAALETEGYFVPKNVVERAATFRVVDADPQRRWHWVNGAPGHEGYATTKPVPKRAAARRARRGR